MTNIDNARTVREAAISLYRAMRRANPDAWAEVDEVEDWAYWDDIVRTAQVTLAAGRAEAWAEGHRTGWEHCQDGNHGYDYWDDPTPNPYAADRPAVTDNARDEEPLAWCPGCGDRIPTEVIRERGVCSNCYGTTDDPWAAGRAETTTATTGAIARGEALAAGDPDWMNVTRWPRTEAEATTVILRLIEENRNLRTTVDADLEYQRRLEARLAAVEALAKGWADMAAQAADDDTREWLAAASRSVLAALSAAPTDTDKETP